MANIILEGFEHGSLLVADLSQVGGIVSGLVPGSTYALNESGGGYRQTFQGYVTPDEIYFGLRMSKTFHSVSSRILRFWDNAGAVVFELRVTTGNVLQVKSGNAGTTLGTGTQVLATNRSYYIEGRYKVHASSGVAQVRIDEQALDIDFSGDTLEGSAANMASLDLFNDANNLTVDDVYVNDTTGSVNTGWWGDVVVTRLIPNAAGDSTQWQIGGSSPPASNYQAVDETGPNDGTDYVYETTLNDLDLYNLPSLPSNLTDPKAVRVVIRAQKNDADLAQVSVVSKTGAGQSDGPDTPLSTTWAYDRRTMNTDPADSAAWTTTKIDALQIGLKVR